MSVKTNKQYQSRSVCVFLSVSLNFVHTCMHAYVVSTVRVRVGVVCVRERNGAACVCVVCICVRVRVLVCVCVCSVCVPPRIAAGAGAL